MKKFCASSVLTGAILGLLSVANCGVGNMRHLVRQVPGQPPQLISAPAPRQDVEPLAALVESTVGPDHGLRPQEALQVCFG